MLFKVVDGEQNMTSMLDDINAMDVYNYKLAADSGCTAKCYRKTITTLN